jgi:hypothetical protein
MRGANRGCAKGAEKAKVLSLELARSLREHRVSAVRSIDGKEVAP